MPEKSFTVLKLRLIFFYEPGYKHVKFLPGIKFKEKYCEIALDAVKEFKNNYNLLSSPLSKAARESVFPAVQP